MSLNINGTGGSGININGSSTSSVTSGGASTVVVDTYPPTNTSATAAASVNCVRQVYNAIGSGGVTVLDVYPPTSTSTTAVPSVRVMTNTFTLANSALSAASAANTLASAALTPTGSGASLDLSTVTTVANVSGTSRFGSSSGQVLLGTNGSSSSSIIGIGQNTGGGGTSTVNISTVGGSASGTVNICTGTTTATPQVHIGDTAGSTVVVSIGASAGTVNIKGSVYNIPNNTFPPTSTVATDTASANVVTQVYNLANMSASTTQAGTVQLIDSTTSTSLTLAPTANALKNVANVANAAITSTTLTTSTNFGGSATGGVVVGLSGQTLTLQSIVNPIAIQVAFSDEATAITTANMTNIRAPYSFNIRTLPLFMLYSLGTAGTTTFDIMKNGQTIYGTKPSISYVASPTNSQYTSTANPGTLLANPTQFSQFDLIKVYVFSAGTGHLGAKCVITMS